MANVEHSAITDPNLHEPKGASTAAANAVYVSDGAGSGSWAAPAALRKIYLTVIIDDISTAGQVVLPIPLTGDITGVWSCLGGTIATSDATLTVKDKDGNSMGTLTVTQSGSAMGDVDTLTPASNNDVAANDWIEIETDGASTNTIPVTLVVEVTVDDS